MLVVLAVLGAWMLISFPAAIVLGRVLRSTHDRYPMFDQIEEE